MFTFIALGEASSAHKKRNILLSFPFLGGDFGLGIATWIWILRPN